MMAFEIVYYLGFESDSPTTDSLLMTVCKRFLACDLNLNCSLQRTNYSLQRCVNRFSCSVAPFKTFGTQKDCDTIIFFMYFRKG